MSEIKEIDGDFADTVSIGGFAVIYDEQGLRVSCPAPPFEDDIDNDNFKLFIGIAKGISQVDKELFSAAVRLYLEWEKENGKAD